MAALLLICGLASYLLLETGDILLLETGDKLKLELDDSPNVSPTSGTLSQGATQQLTAAQFTGGTVTWSSNATGIATVNGSGIVTAVAHGQATSQTATITATGVANPSETGTYVVAVSAVSVSVTPTSTSIGTDATVQLSSTVTGAVTTTVTWSLVSGSGSVDSNGLYTAPSSATTAVVRATSTVDTARYSQCTITVTATRVVEAVAPYGTAYTGQSIGYTVYNADGTVAQARTTSGVIEITGGTGIYVVGYAAAQSFAGLIVWDAPTGLDPYVQEIEPYISGTTRVIVAVAPYGVLYTGQSIGYTIRNTDGTTTPAPGQAFTTSGVIEIASLGIYLVQITTTTSASFVVVWSAPSGLDPYVLPISVSQIASSGSGSGGSIFSRIQTGY